jgi:hypothetical protein
VTGPAGELSPGLPTGDPQPVQVTHQNTLGTLTPAFLQGPGSAGLGQAGNTDIVSNINALSAELAHSELAKVAGASGANGQTIPDNHPSTGTLLHPDQPDQNQLLPPYHHH